MPPRISLYVTNSCRNTYACEAKERTMVERSLGEGKVESSILSSGTTLFPRKQTPARSSESPIRQVQAEQSKNMNENPCTIREVGS